jgi:transcription-repair coupling factor (superfamily II helicase)
MLIRTMDSAKAPEHGLPAVAARVAARLQRERRGTVQGLRGPARAAFLAVLHRLAPRPLLVVTATAAAAEALALDLHFFLGEEPGADALKKRVHVLPAWDVAPFAPMSPSPETLAQRIEGLYHLGQTPNPIVVTTAEAAVQKAVAPAALRESVAYLVEGDEVDLPSLGARLLDWGYKRRPLVEDRGEFAVRGGLIDVFGTGFQDPVRLELLGDLLESIRSFDPRSQRRLADREDVLLLPATEFPLRARRDAERRRRVEERAREIEMPRAERLQVLEALGEGFPLPGIEVLVPYFAAVGPLTDHLSAEALIVIDEQAAVAEAASEAHASALVHAEQAVEERRLHPPVEELYLSSSELAAALGGHPLLTLESLATLDGEAAGAERASSRLPFDLRAARLLREEKGFAALAGRVREWTRARQRVALVVGTAAQAERLQHVLESQDLIVPALGDSLPVILAERDRPRERPSEDGANGQGRATHAEVALAGDGADPAEVASVRGSASLDDGGAFVLVGDLSESIELPDDRLVCVAERDLFGEHRRTRRRRAAALSLDQVMESLAQLQPGQHIVHVDHGIGLYQGLKHLTVAGTEGDFLHLDYLGGDRLYLPVDRVNLVQKYVGGEGAQPALDKLGGATWDRVKKKTKESILAMAHELLSLYATRERHHGHAFNTSDPLYQEFEARFPFEETPDQQRAIDEVLGDMSSPKPMDRLVCGDVGYGKTEVAMRAAFVSAMEGQQVAVLVPTTVLALQHFENLKRRFEGYPLVVEMLSSFRTKKENLEVVGRLASGAVDIVVGTHRLLQGDVQFARLGLLVVDEEHRFGVKDKERIKQMRKLVDVLTLTATPIPRTLELSLTGIRDLSVIETPPLDRQAIRTYVTKFDGQVIREAILRELHRGGQVFFVHNRVESIERRAEILRALVPEARIVVAHGQMREHQLEKVMMAFLQHDHDILLCTAIIESGLDIPNANTILIDRADTFGLAQLYQLRGRVGRSPAQAYSYLLIPGEQILTDDAKLRLQVLQELDELGGGFRIAAHDLEIRGAGNLLGKQQSGHITAVGFELYTQMMEEAVQELRGEPPDRDIEPEIQIGIPAYIPESYVDDVNQRLVLYKRLAALRGPEDVGVLADEIRDRFGPLPALVETLLEVMELRRRMKILGIAEARLRGPRLALRLHPISPIAPERLVEMIAEGAGRYVLAPDGTFSVAIGEETARLAELRTALDLLEPLAGAGRAPALTSLA